MLLKALLIAVVRLGFVASRTVLVTTDKSPTNLLPPPAIPKIFDGHRGQGTALSEKFFTIPLAKQSDDLVGSEDWIIVDEADSSPEQISEVLGSARQIQKSLGGWKDVTYSQSRKYRRQLTSGRMQKPSLATYRAVSSHGDGVFVFMDFQSPEDTKPDLDPEHLPWLQRLEDVAYLDWSRGKEGLEPPTWFLLRNITNHESADRDQDNSIISSCLRFYKLPNPPPWPGITFPIGSTCFRAILGTYPSIEMGCLLLRFTNAAMASVTIYTEGNTIDLLWFGGKLDLKQLKAGEAANVAYERKSPGKLGFPYGMVLGKDTRIVPFRGKKRPVGEMEG